MLSQMIYDQIEASGVQYTLSTFSSISFSSLSVLNITEYSHVDQAVTNSLS